MKKKTGLFTGIGTAAVGGLLAAALTLNLVGETVKAANYESLPYIEELVAAVETGMREINILEIVPETNSGMIGYFLDGSEPIRNVQDYLSGTAGQNLRQDRMNAIADRLRGIGLLSPTPDGAALTGTGLYEELYPWDMELYPNGTLNISGYETLTLDNADTAQVSGKMERDAKGDYNPVVEYVGENGDYVENVAYFLPVSAHTTAGTDAKTAYAGTEGTVYYYQPTFEAAPITGGIDQQDIGLYAWLVPAGADFDESATYMRLRSDASRFETADDATAGSDIQYLYVLKTAKTDEEGIYGYLGKVSEILQNSEVTYYKISESFAPFDNTAGSADRKQDTLAIYTTERYSSFEYAGEVGDEGLNLTAEHYYADADPQSLTEDDLYINGTAVFRIETVTTYEVVPLDDVDESNRTTFYYKTPDDSYEQVTEGTYTDTYYKKIDTTNYMPVGIVGKGFNEDAAGDFVVFPSAAYKKFTEEQLNWEQLSPEQQAELTPPPSAGTPVFTLVNGADAAKETVDNYVYVGNVSNSQNASDGELIPTRDTVYYTHRIVYTDVTVRAPQFGDEIYTVGTYKLVEGEAREEAIGGTGDLFADVNGLTKINRLQNIANETDVYVLDDPNGYTLYVGTLPEEPAEGTYYVCTYWQPLTKADLTDTTAAPAAIYRYTENENGVRYVRIGKTGSYMKRLPDSYEPQQASVVVTGEGESAETKTYPYFSVVQKNNPYALVESGQTGWFRVKSYRFEGIDQGSYEFTPILNGGSVYTVETEAVFFKLKITNNNWFLRYVLDWQGETRDPGTGASDAQKESYQQFCLLRDSVQVVCKTPAEVTTGDVYSADLLILSGGLAVLNNAAPVYNSSLSDPVFNEIRTEASASDRQLPVVVFGAAAVNTTNVYQLAFELCEMAEITDNEMGSAKRNVYRMATDTDENLINVLAKFHYSTGSGRDAAGLYVGDTLARYYDDVLNQIQQENFLRGQQGISWEQYLPEIVNPATCIRYVLNFVRDRRVYKDSITVLDLEPTGAGTSGLKNSIAEWTGLTADKITVITQSTSEFVGKIDDLAETYDIVYIGANISELNTSGGLTRYRDSNMDGLIYTNIGDLYKTNYSNMAGMTEIEYISGGTAINGSSSDYLLFRLSGNDLTTIKAKQLKDFAAAGYPVILANELVQSQSVETSTYFFVTLVFDEANRQLVATLNEADANGQPQNRSLDPSDFTFHWYFSEDGEATRTLNESGYILHEEQLVSGTYYCTAEMRDGTGTTELIGGSAGQLLPKSNEVTLTREQDGKLSCRKVAEGEPYTFIVNGSTAGDPFELNVSLLWNEQTGTYTVDDSEIRTTEGTTIVEYVWHDFYEETDHETGKTVTGQETAEELAAAKTLQPHDDTESIVWCEVKFTYQYATGDEENPLSAEQNCAATTPKYSRNQATLRELEPGSPAKFSIARTERVSLSAGLNGNHEANGTRWNPTGNGYSAGTETTTVVVTNTASSGGRVTAQTAVLTGRQEGTRTGTTNYRNTYAVTWENPSNTDLSSAVYTWYTSETGTGNWTPVANNASANYTNNAVSVETITAVRTHTKTQSHTWEYYSNCRGSGYHWSDDTYEWTQTNYPSFNNVNWDNRTNQNQQGWSAWSVASDTVSVTGDYYVFCAIRVNVGGETKTVTTPIYHSGALATGMSASVAISGETVTTSTGGHWDVVIPYTEDVGVTITYDENKVFTVAPDKEGYEIVSCVWYEKSGSAATFSAVTGQTGNTLTGYAGHDVYCVASVNGQEVLDGPKTVTSPKYRISEDPAHTTCAIVENGTSAEIARFDYSEPVTVNAILSYENGIFKASLVNSPEGYSISSCKWYVDGNTTALSGESGSTLSGYAGHSVSCEVTIAGTNTRESSLVATATTLTSDSNDYNCTDGAVTADSTKLTLTQAVTVYAKVTSDGRLLTADIDYERSGIDAADGFTVGSVMWFDATNTLLSNGTSLTMASYPGKTVYAKLSVTYTAPDGNTETNDVVSPKVTIDTGAATEGSGASSATLTGTKNVVISGTIEYSGGTYTANWSSDDTVYQKNGFAVTSYIWHYKNPGATAYKNSDTYTTTGNTISESAYPKLKGKTVYCELVVKYTAPNGDTETHNVTTPEWAVTNSTQSSAIGAGSTATINVTSEVTVNSTLTRSGNTYTVGTTFGDSHVSVKTYQWYYKRHSDSQYTAVSGNNRNTLTGAAYARGDVYCVLTLQSSDPTITAPNNDWTLKTPTITNTATQSNSIVDGTEASFTKTDTAYVSVDAVTPSGSNASSKYTISLNVNGGTKSEFEIIGSTWRYSYSYKKNANSNTKTGSGVRTKAENSNPENLVKNDVYADSVYSFSFTDVVLQSVTVRWTKDPENPQTLVLMPNDNKTDDNISVSMSNGTISASYTGNQSVVGYTWERATGLADIQTISNASSSTYRPDQTGFYRCTIESSALGWGWFSSYNTCPWMYYNKDGLTSPTLIFAKTYTYKYKITTIEWNNNNESYRASIDADTELTNVVLTWYEGGSQGSGTISADRITYTPQDPRNTVYCQASIAYNGETQQATSPQYQITYNQQSSQDSTVKTLTKTTAHQYTSDLTWKSTDGAYQATVTPAEGSGTPSNVTYRWYLGDSNTAVAGQTSNTFAPDDPTVKVHAEATVTYSGKTAVTKTPSYQVSFTKATSASGTGTPQTFSRKLPGSFATVIAWDGPSQTYTATVSKATDSVLATADVTLTYTWYEGTAVGTGAKTNGNRTYKPVDPTKAVYCQVTAAYNAQSGTGRSNSWTVSYSTTNPGTADTGTGFTRRYPGSFDTVIAWNNTTKSYTATVTAKTGADYKLGTDDVVLTYLWYENGNAVNTATSATYAPADPTKEVYCQVTAAAKSGGYATLTSTAGHSISKKISFTYHAGTDGLAATFHKRADERDCFGATLTWNSSTRSYTATVAAVTGSPLTLDDVTIVKYDWICGSDSYEATSAETSCSWVPPHPDEECRCIVTIQYEDAFGTQTRSASTAEYQVAFSYVPYESGTQVTFTTRGGKKPSFEITELGWDGTQYTAHLSKLNDTLDFDQIASVTFTWTETDQNGTVIKQEPLTVTSDFTQNLTFTPDRPRDRVICEAAITLKDAQEATAKSPVCVVTGDIVDDGSGSPAEIFGNKLKVWVFTTTRVDEEGTKVEFVPLAPCDESGSWLKDENDQVRELPDCRLVVRMTTNEGENEINGSQWGTMPESGIYTVDFSCYVQFGYGKNLVGADFAMSPVYQVSRTFGSIKETGTVGSHSGYAKATTHAKDYSLNANRIDANSELYKALSAVIMNDNVMRAPGVNDDESLTTLRQYLTISKPEIVWQSIPVPYDGTAAHCLTPDESGKYYLDYTFQIDNLTDPTPLTTTYHVKLYIDTNSNGLFTESEYVSDIIVRNEQGVMQPNAAGRYELLAGTTYTIRREMPGDYYGLIPWKMTVIKNNVIKSDGQVLDYSHIHASDNGYTRIAGRNGSKTPIRVLQLVPNSGGLNLATNTTYQRYLSGNAGVELDFNVSIETITIQRFNDAANAAAGNPAPKFYKTKNNSNALTMSTSRPANTTGVTEYDSFTEFLDSYDMLILGFEDCYGDLNLKAGLAVADFAAEDGLNKALLVTHDTTSVHNLPRSNYPVQTTANNRTNTSYTDTAYYWGYTFNTVLRSVVYQDRYGVTDSKLGRTVQQKNDNAYQTGHATLTYTGTLTDGLAFTFVNWASGNATEGVNTGSKTVTINTPYLASGANLTRGATDTAEILRQAKLWLAEYYGYINAYGFGQNNRNTALGARQGFSNMTLINRGVSVTGNKNPTNKTYDNSTASGSARRYTRTVSQVNEGQITTYPYNINGRNISVAETHEQYYQLNLESDDIVVWYCLSGQKGQNYGSNYTNLPNDVRNSYYIYTVGNITYTGAGHSGATTTDDEAKLFVNTMFAAFRTQVSDPEVTFTVSEDSTAQIQYCLVNYDYVETNPTEGGGRTSPDIEDNKLGGKIPVHFYVSDPSLAKNQKDGNVVVPYFYYEVIYQNGAGSLKYPFNPVVYSADGFKKGEASNTVDGAAVSFLGQDGYVQYCTPGGVSYCIDLSQCTELLNKLNSDGVSGIRLYMTVARASDEVPSVEDTTVWTSVEIRKVGLFPLT